MTALTLLVLLAGSLLPLVPVVGMGMVFGPKAAAVTFVVIYGGMLAKVVQMARKAPHGREIPFVGYMNDEHGEVEADVAASIAFVLLMLLILAAPFVGWH